MLRFVDDSTCQTNDFLANNQPSLPDLICQMEADAQLWNMLLHTLGGRLKIPKCSYHVIYFEFHDLGLPRMKLLPEGPQL